MIGQSAGAYTDATHGMTLSAVSLPYYRFIMLYGLKKFKRFAEEVWKVCPEGKTDEQIAEEGLAAMENWMRKLGVAMKLSEIGGTEAMIDGITEGTIILEGGYKILTRDEVRQIVRESM
jgi:alcohol dehydrogenase YqhD (iron-dependent ADH family)